MKKYLLLCDMFGQTPGFYISHNKELKSYLGAILTILIIILCIILGCILGKELFQKKNPKITLSTETFANPSKINYFDNYEVLLAINNQNKIPQINEQIYYAKANLFKTIVSSSGSHNDIVDIKITRCNETMKTSSNYNLVKELDLSNFYCLDKTNKDSIYINEFWGNNNFQMIQIKLYSCDNNTMNNTCKSESEINSFLNNPTLQLYLIDNYAKTNDYQNPFQKYLRNKFYYVSNTFHVSLTEYIHHVNMKTDKGLIFSIYNEKNNFTIDNLIDFTIYNRNDTILSFSIQLNNVIEKYSRNYYKIHDLAAEIGGIYSILSVVLYFLLTSFSENIYFEYLINNFFYIDVFKKKEYNNDLKNSNIQKKINDILNTETNHNLESKNNNNNKQIVSKDTITNFNKNFLKRKGSIMRKIPRNNLLTNKKIIIKSKESYKIKLNIIGKFNLICLNKFTKKKDEIILFNTGKKHLKNYLEINNFINFYHNNHVLMDLLFSEKKQNIFSFISEPILSFDFIGSRYDYGEIPKKIRKKLFEIN